MILFITNHCKTNIRSVTNICRTACNSLKSFFCTLQPITTKELHTFYILFQDENHRSSISTWRDCTRTPEREYLIQNESFYFYQNWDVTGRINFKFSVLKYNNPSISCFNLVVRHILLISSGSSNEAKKNDQ